MLDKTHINLLYRWGMVWNIGGAGLFVENKIIQFVFKFLVF